MRKSKPHIQFLALVALWGTACAVGEPKRDAQQVVEQYFETVRTHSLDTVLAFYDEQFFTYTPDTTWIGMLRRVREKLGDLQSFAQTDWRVGRSTRHGTMVQLTYTVTYSKYTATEAFILKRSHDDGAFKIIGQNINSEGLLLE